MYVSYNQRQIQTSLVKLVYVSFRYRTHILILMITVTLRIFLTMLCHICGILIASNSSLRQHLWRHELEEKYSCEECDLVFFSTWNSTRHMRRDTINSDKPFKCNKCQETFLTQNDLRRHQKREAGDLHFWCETCGGKFEDAAKLQDHKGLHTADKRHTCSTCGRKFRYGSNLSRHMKEHEN